MQNNPLSIIFVVTSIERQQHPYDWLNKPILLLKNVIQNSHLRCFVIWAFNILSLVDILEHANPSKAGLLRVCRSGGC